MPAWWGKKSGRSKDTENSPKGSSLKSTEKKKRGAEIENKVKSFDEVLLHRHQSRNSPRNSRDFSGNSSGFSGFDSVSSLDRAHPLPRPSEPSNDHAPVFGLESGSGSVSSVSSSGSSDDHTHVAGDHGAFRLVCFSAFFLYFFIIIILRFLFCFLIWNFFMNHGVIFFVLFVVLSAVIIFFFLLFSWYTVGFDDSVCWFLVSRTWTFCSMGLRKLSKILCYLARFNPRMGFLCPFFFCRLHLISWQGYTLRLFCRRLLLRIHFCSNLCLYMLLLKFRRKLETSWIIFVYNIWVWNF